MKFRSTIFPILLTATFALLTATPWMQAEPVQYELPPETVRFKPGDGAVKAVAHCSMCHSADYISTQPTLSRDKWKALVVKMKKIHGAPIPEAEVDPIVDYLVKNYGDEAPAKSDS